jgi:hypothetical protein
VVRVQPNPLDGGPDVSAPDPCGDGQVNVFCGFYDSLSGTPYRGWRNYPGDEWADAGYWKDGEGVVHLTGLLAATAANRPDGLFVLPPAYRPATNVIVTASCYEGGASDPGACVVYVYANGLVTWAYGFRPTPFISLDGISFRKN